MAKDAVKGGKPPSMRELLKQSQKALKPAGTPADVSVQPASAPPQQPLSEESQRLRDAVLGIEAVSGEVGGLKMIPVDLIDENPLPQRSVYLDEEIREIAASLRTNEQRDPIHVRPNPDKPGRYIICDGWTRVLATRKYGAELGLPQVMEARIRNDMDDLQGCLHGYLQNEERNALADIDKGLLFHKLVHERKMSSRDVMAMFGIHQDAEMSFYTSFGKLTPDVIALISPYKDMFSKSFAYEVARIQKDHGEKASQVAAQLVVGREAGGKQLTLQELKQLHEKMDKAAAVGQAYLDAFLDKLMSGHAEGVEKPSSTLGKKTERFSEHCVLTDKGSQVDIKLSKLDPAKKAALLERLRPILKELFQA